jgi:hypothetical protein
MCCLAMPVTPNNSFKPTPHRGGSHVHTLRQHVSAAPLRGGLTQALGGRKALCSFVLRSSRSSASAGVALRTCSPPAASSVKYVWRAHTLHALRLLASETVVSFQMACPLQMRSLRRLPADSSRGALKCPSFGFRQWRWGFVLAGFLRA